MNPKAKIGLLAAVAVCLVLVFLLIQSGGDWGYVLRRRGLKLLAIVLTGAAIAFSTMVFQTVTNNRILTPSIIGLDSLYMFVQTFVVFAFGSGSLTMTNRNLNFVLSIVAMIGFAMLLYRFLFKREGRNIYFLLLVGIVMGSLFGSMSTFMEVLIDPNEFMIVQDKMFASFNRMNTDVLVLSVLAFAAVAAYAWRFLKLLDVLAMGREHALNLGIRYEYVVKRLLILVAILVSISTALVGPITFLGLLVANLAHQFMRTYRHGYLIAGSIFISIIALVGGQLVVERVFTFSTTISVIVNFVGGVYFLYLLLKESKSW
ncbi:iron chelate uptake ABC transporter family permease subunit [Paenibacillus flagellatus]|uniref:Iron ABC transporter permease n=1 Tax=Paenibacillus flagellatus TaxID=2211139 RepID=A0A2V5KC71_9BACL|nr:iron chelate uptake ABC transporter family permease subunit [Paenibacillus flagellatus]PYI56592.1 iron ABC transporter permease [Paenibacillus flagellatus]